MFTGIRKGEDGGRRLERAVSCVFGVRPQAVGAMEGKIAFETDGDVPTMASSSNRNENSQGRVNEIEGLHYFPLHFLCIVCWEPLMLSLIKP